MNRAQFEALVLDSLERVTKRQPVEDAQIELKTVWIDPVKAARRIAAHANSAAGLPVIWIIGVNEKEAAIVGAAADEVSTWLQRLEVEFNEVAPALLEHLVIPNPQGPPVVALMFDTSRAPYGVRNPQPPSPGHGRAELEFPWRDGTRTRSAKRSELLRILAGSRLAPDVEELEAWLAVQNETLSMEEGPLAVVTWDFAGSVYLTPRDDRPVTIPFHQCHATAEFDGGFAFALNDMRLGPEILATAIVYHTVSALGSPSAPATPMRKESEAYLPSPSKLVLTGRVILEAHPIPKGIVRMSASLGVAGSRASVSIAWRLEPTRPRRPYESEWTTIAG